MSELEQEVRKPGRPKSQSENPPLKKGKSSWKPASVTDVTNKEPGFRYRWINKLPDNLAKKAAEGWETVSGVTSDKAKASPEDSGKNPTSVFEKRDLILARIPEEVALERDAYMSEKTQKRTLGLTAHLKKEAGESKARLHGSITISSRQGEQVID